jgi:hypothetical protein
MENTSVAQQWIYANHIENLSLYCCIYSVLHSNGSYPTVACVSFAAGMRLLSRFLETAYMPQYFILTFLYWLKLTYSLTLLSL